MQHRIYRQSGVVLMVSLIMLLLLTIIGVSASQVTTLEEKMAGNSHDQNIAFQAAEDALRRGEQVVEQLLNLNTFTPADPNNNPNNADGKFSAGERPDYTDANIWADNTSEQVTNVIPLVATQPRYFIHFIGNQPSDPLDSSSDPISMFRIVARGTGRQNTTQVFLQVYYGKMF